MKLLIITQKVNKNDDILGFFHGWLLEFAKNYEKVTVICLEKGEYDLPENVKVLSLGKEARENGGEASASGSLPSVFARLLYIKNFYKYIWQERNNYNKVFVHMNPEYVILGGLFWRFWGKKVTLWYVHKNVDLKLRIAEKLANVIFTASEESFRLKSKKIRVVGHGVDTNKLKCGFEIKPKKFDVIMVGRISKIKNQKLLIEAVDILAKEKGLKNIKVGLIGWFSSEKDKIYFNKLKDLVEKKKLTKNIIFIGSKPNREIVNYYCDTKVSVNLCPTGGMDKVVLESMSCGVPVVVLNKTFQKILNNSRFILEKEDPKELADKIEDLFEFDVSFRNRLRQIIVDNYSWDELVQKIGSEL